jgi:hypothetical protein
MKPVIREVGDSIVDRSTWTMFTTEYGPDGSIADLRVEDLTRRSGDQPDDSCDRGPRSRHRQGFIRKAMAWLSRSPR